MRIGVFGAGAIGGLMAVKLAQAGADVTVVARGPHLAAMQADGLTLTAPDAEPQTVRVRAVQTADAAGPQDAVIVTLKAHGLIGAAPDIARMLAPDGCVVLGVNGVPYWYFSGLPGANAGRIVQAVDPDGAVSRHLPPSRAVGCVVYPAAEITAPGIIHHTYGDRFSLGEPSGERTERVNALSRALIAAGFRAPVRPKIREEIWVKLWGNMAFNPLSVLTGATLDRLTGEPALRDVARAMMLEGQAVAEALGIRFALDVDARIAGAAEVGTHRTSMLQDFELGRPLELGALLGAVLELADVTGIAAPVSRTIHALVAARIATRDAMSAA